MFQSPADIYALGVIGYEMLAGHQPFPGPGLDDFAEQHQKETPPQLQCPDGALIALIHELAALVARQNPIALQLSAQLGRNG